jgi:hypothetical protein
VFVSFSLCLTTGCFSSCSCLFSVITLSGAGINEKKSHAQFSLQGNGEKSKHFAFKCETSNSTSFVSKTQNPDTDIAALTQKKYHHCKDLAADSETKDEIDELACMLDSTVFGNLVLCFVLNVLGTTLHS